MKIGAMYPQIEIGGDTNAIRAFAERLEELEYSHLLTADHVLGVDSNAHRDWKGPYDVKTTFREPFVLFGYLASFTSIELVTGILVLPQRQTALVAKQAAEVDLLSAGRFRLGVGVGWHELESRALGYSFGDRGKRIDEQVNLLRRLWSEESVNHVGNYEQVVGLGISPLPVQRPIPVWFGATTPPAYRRAGRLGDGWFPLVPPGPELNSARAIVEKAAIDAGRDPTMLGMEGRIHWRDGTMRELARQASQWKKAGATHLHLDTRLAGLNSLGEHLDALAAVASFIHDV